MDWNQQVFKLNLKEYTLDFFSNTTIDSGRSDRGWNWLVCNEFGWFQGPSNLNYPIHSQLLDLNFYRHFCKSIFFLGIEPPAIEASNSYYGGQQTSGKNTMFMTAVEDPW